jgi:S-adenosylmethionine decarboxylase
MCTSGRLGPGRSQGVHRVNGVEWLIDLSACEVSPLRDPHAMLALFDSIVDRVGLRPLGRPAWHQFPTTGGVTAVWMLQESHLTIHTFPEFASASLNLFCCTPRECPDWQALLTDSLGPCSVRVTQCDRDYGAGADQLPFSSRLGAGVDAR